MSKEIIDFRQELERHQEFLGREDMIAELRRALPEGGTSRGWILVKGSPGRGKSALLYHVLSLIQAERRVEAAVPRHFLRRGFQGWDRPELVMINLAARIEALYPKARDPEARPETRLFELLDRVSHQHLVPGREQLLLVIDGIDEVDPGIPGQNPLGRFLPPALPPGVTILCSSRPNYPHLSWIEQREHLLQVIDLDDTAWAPSNEQLCRSYWERHAGDFTPPLSTKEMREVLRISAGNILAALRLYDDLVRRPESRARLVRIPAGVSGLMGEFWARIAALPDESFVRTSDGLGALTAAREALPLHVLAVAAGWGNVRVGAEFLAVARPFLYEEPAHWVGVPAYRLYHEAFREFLADQQGPETMALRHREIGERLANWPIPEDEVLGYRYTLRHAIEHALGAGVPERAAELCVDLEYLQARLVEVGTPVVEVDLARVAVAVARGEPKEALAALIRVVQAESHWLREAPEALSRLVYNRLRSAGWTEELMSELVSFRHGFPSLRLRHPVRFGGGELRTFQGHADAVTGCAITPDGKRVVSTSRDKTLKLWDLDSGQCLHTLHGHTGSVTGCAITLDGRRIVSSSYDKTLKVWDRGSGRLLHTLQGHAGGVTACAVTPDGKRIVSASSDKTLKIWDLDSGQLLHTLQDHWDEVTGCAVTPDGRRAVSASYDKALKVWDLESGQLLRTLQGHGDGLTGCAVTPDGRLVVSASWDATLKVWDLESGELQRTLAGHTDRVTGCTITPDGRHVISACDDTTLNVWELESGQLVHILHGHSGGATGCAAAPNGRHLVSASSDATLKFWDLRYEMLVQPLHSHSDSVTSCTLTPSGRGLVSSSYDDTLKVWDLESGQLQQTIHAYSEGVTGCAATHDGRRIVASCEDETLKVWDLESGQLLHTLLDHTRGVTGCVLMPDGRRMVSSSDDQAIKLWDLESGQLLRTFQGHTGGVAGCALTPDGRRIISAARDTKLKVWDIESGQLLHTLHGHFDAVASCTVTLEGRRVVSASWDHTLKLWDLDSGQCLHTFQGHTDVVTGCALTPDGKHVISSSDDRTLKLWDLERPVLLDTLYGVAPFTCVSTGAGLIFAGDRLGNVWILEA
ncbi:MAG TPA: NACHT domain-containing protein [Polyangia bacterium]|nr:NACHT domain-containing protein [Polyangia bacterium]